GLVQGQFRGREQPGVVDHPAQQRPQAGVHGVGPLPNSLTPYYLAPQGPGQRRPPGGAGPAALTAPGTRPRLLVEQHRPHDAGPHPSRSPPPPLPRLTFPSKTRRSPEVLVAGRPAARGRLPAPRRPSPEEGSMSALSVAVSWGRSRDSVLLLRTRAKWLEVA